MEHNEISMFMDAKLHIHDKRAVALKFKSWTRCQVKIEAIKCVPCFLRITFKNCEAESTDKLDAKISSAEEDCLTVSVNVPGVSLSLATSRTKQYSYGLFWTQNRRDCFIYFALETEASCRRHMKWMKKSIKNLELFRQVFLEQKRLSRGPTRLQQLAEYETDQSKSKDFGPLPNVPDLSSLDANSFSTRASRVSEIYEEIFEDSRLSRSSIASGIYEEMKPSAQNFQAIVEEPPALPPLPTQRKRLNTYAIDEQGMVGEIPRSNTNPESELAKKKKYKILLDNIFGNTRQKRAGSISECTTTSDTPTSQEQHMHENASTSPLITAIKRRSNIAKSHRNSFSSPDLSKLNFLSNSIEPSVCDTSDELKLSLDESDADVTTRGVMSDKKQSQLSKADSLESLNVSEKLPNNFNFSACNTSSINLIGASGAVPNAGLLHKNKIVFEDLTGYCVMAPIVKKDEQQAQKTGSSTESTTSGYSTGSYCSSTSSCNNDEQAQLAAVLLGPTTQQPQVELPQQNDSDIYEPMHGGGGLLNTSSSNEQQANANFAEHLYENLLAVKAAQELEQNVNTIIISTSTPTDSPQLPALPQKGTPKSITEEPEEDYYQTPRKSIISVDEKIPSYYPNSCDTIKSKRHSRSPGLNTEQSAAGEKSSGLRHLVNIKMRRERKENLYISSPQQIIEQRKKSGSGSSSTSKSSKSKKPAAHKISENVYAVTHASKKSSKSTDAQTVALSQHNNNNNNKDGGLTPEMQEKLQAELLQLAMLQNIDFKFDDGASTTPTVATANKAEDVPKRTPNMLPTHNETEYEHCYQAAESATRLLQKYATFAKFGISKSPANAKPVATVPPKMQLPPVKQQLLQVPEAMPNLSPAGNTVIMTQSTVTPTDTQLSGVRKFASLPRFKKIDFSPLKLRINNVLQRNQPTPQPSPQPEV